MQNSTGLKAQLCIQDSAVQHGTASNQISSYADHQLCGVQWSGSLPSEEADVNEGCTVDCVGLALADT